MQLLDNINKKLEELDEVGIIESEGGKDVWFKTTPNKEARRKKGISFLLAFGILKRIDTNQKTIVAPIKRR